MIGSLRGTLAERVPRGDHAAEVLIDVGGVGYRVVMPVAAAVALGDVGRTVSVQVHTHVREDAIVLFGFASADERTCFELLIAAHGVGPAVGLALLSVLRPAALRQAVLAGDADALTTVPGIGKKTAARLLIELRPRFDALVDRELTLVTAPGGSPGDRSGAARQEVRAALLGLGYSAEEIRAVLGSLPVEGSAEELLRYALKELAAAR